jgi:hypothetical protein
MNPTLPGGARPTGRRLDPKFAPLLVPAYLWTYLIGGPSESVSAAPRAGVAAGQGEPDLGISPAPRRAVPPGHKDRVGASTVWAILWRAGLLRHPGGRP